MSDIDLEVLMIKRQGRVNEEIKDLLSGKDKEELLSIFIRIVSVLDLGRGILHLLVLLIQGEDQGYFCFQLTWFLLKCS
jgi:hypothetical protein